MTPARQYVPGMPGNNHGKNLQTSDGTGYQSVGENTGKNIFSLGFYKFVIS